MIEVERLIVKIGYAPNTEIFANQIDMDESGHIRVNSECGTSVKAVFAGGDIVTPGFDRIANAMGNGLLAARSIRKYLESLSN
jgi:thioredoxin reductase (NADPH)